MKRNLSLFAKYGLLLAAMLGVAIVLQGLIQAALTYRAAIELVQQRQHNEARYVAERLNGFIHRADDALGWLQSLVPPGAAPDWDALRNEIHVAMRREPALLSVTLFADDGSKCVHVHRSRFDPVCRPPEGIAPPDGSTGAPSYGPVRLVEDSLPVMTAAKVLAASPRVVAAAEVNLSSAWEIVAGAQIADDGVAYLLDPDGRLIAHPDVALVLRGTQVKPDIGASTGDSALASLAALSRNIARGRVVRASVELERLPWLAVVETSTQAALRPAVATVIQAAVVTAIGLALAVASSIAFARRLSAPIRALRQGALDIGGGNLRRRLSIDSEDEIGDLARAFNSMAAQLADYTDGLERKVAEKTRELAAANDHKSEFLANVSHELRTPLNAVIGFSEALRERIFGELNAKQLEYVNDIHGSGLHLLALINDLLDLSKVEAGRMELDVAPCDVRSLIEGAAALLRDRAARGDVQLDLAFGAGVSTWEADERRLRQIVLNLLSNAVKFTRSGGAVRLSADQTDAELKLEVSDTGVGIAAEELTMLFEPFRQLRRPDPPREGTGLGLALTRRLVELHGGTIGVTSTPGIGSVFTVTLPRPRSGEAGA